MVKVVVIGGNAAGLSAASAIKRTKPDWEVNVYEKGSYISYGSCGLPYYVAGMVKSSDKLITLTRETLLNKRNIPVYIHHNVKAVDFDNKTVTVENLDENKEFTEKYDYLFISTGAKPKLTEGLDVDHPRVFKVHVIDDADYIKEQVSKYKMKTGIIIGSGYIGLEMLEAYEAVGVEKLILIGKRLVFKSKTAEYVQNELEKHNIQLVIGHTGEKIIPLSDERLKVITDDNQEFEGDFVQVSIGVVPNTDMFKGTKLKMIKGAILTDEYMRTNIEGVYAGGDCCAVYHQIKKKYTYVPLAPAANKQGRLAGYTIAGKKVDPYPGVVGTSIFKVFDLHCAKTGVNLEEAKELGYNAESIIIENNEIAHYYPGVKKMSILLVFDKDSHLFLGGEITAPSPLGAKKIDVLATCLAAKMKIDDMQKLDLAYAPPFAPTYDPVLIAANVARRKCK
ncbi:MAG: FAD-dependent oxidoreductase [Promethearchaeota archaeon]